MSTRTSVIVTSIAVASSACLFYAAPASARVPSTAQVERVVQRKLPSIGIRRATVEYCDKVSSRKWKCEVSSRTLVGQTVIATYRGGTIHVKRQALRDSVGSF